MSKKDGVALAIAALGTGLLNYGAKKEDLRFQREREENLRRLQESQHGETVRHNQAVETYQGETLKADVKHKADTLALEGTKAENEREYQKGLLVNDTAKTKAQAAESASRTETDRLNAERQAAEASLVWNPETKKYETDENLLKDNLRKIEAEGKARASAWGGSLSATDREYDRKLATALKLREEGDPKFAGMTDAQIQATVQASVDEGATRNTGTDAFVRAEILKTKYNKLADDLKAAVTDEQRAQIKQEMADTETEWSRVASGTAAGGNTSGGPVSATAAGAKFLQGLNGK